MKIVCNPKELGELVRACYDCKVQRDCEGCLFYADCAQEMVLKSSAPMFHIEDICEIEVE